MARNARKLITADGVVVNRSGKLKAVIPATAGTGVHSDLDLNFTKLYADVTGTLSLNVLYE